MISTMVKAGVNAGVKKVVWRARRSGIRAATGGGRTGTVEAAGTEVWVRAASAKLIGDNQGSQIVVAHVAGQQPVEQTRARYESGRKSEPPARIQ
jgi:hypothetical protein